MGANLSQVIASLQRLTRTNGRRSNGSHLHTPSFEQLGKKILPTTYVVDSMVEGSGLTTISDVESEINYVNYFLHNTSYKYV